MSIADHSNLRAQFPVLKREGLAYLDSAASCQKPQSVIDTMTAFYQHDYATVHRGVYRLSQDSTTQYDGVRTKIKTLINAAHDREIIFTKGATEAINLVAACYGNTFFDEGDELIVSEIEHHANFVPWQQLALEKNLILKIIPVLDDGSLDMNAYQSLLSENTALVAIQHVSNVLGTIHPIKEMIQEAHTVGAKVLVDACQSVSHIAIDVQDLDCDFLCFSSHKFYGPTGVGVLYGKDQLLEQMPPYQLGGDMIESVTLEKTTYAKHPMRFEAGTPPIAEVIGLGAACDFVSAIGLDQIAKIEENLLKEATEKLLAIPGVRLIGTAKDKTAVISFLVDDIHPHDIGTVCDTQGVAIRAGHHCSQTTMTRYGVSATARASFACYNNSQDIDALIKAIKHLQEIFG